jgi:hypothetical protein
MQTQHAKHFSTAICLTALTLGAPSTSNAQSTTAPEPDPVQGEPNAVEDETDPVMLMFFQVLVDFAQTPAGTLEATLGPWDQTYFSVDQRADPPLDQGANVPWEERVAFLAIKLYDQAFFEIVQPLLAGQLQQQINAAPSYMAAQAAKKGFGRGGGCGGGCWAKTNNPLTCQDCVDLCCILPVNDPKNPPLSYRQCITAGYLICDVGFLSN